MDRFSMILSALLVLTLLVVVSPGILAMNRGKILRNIALWLALALGLALIYQTFGPGKDLLKQPAAPEDESGEDESTSGSRPSDGDPGYLPPREE